MKNWKKRKSAGAVLGKVDMDGISEHLLFTWDMKMEKRKVFVGFWSM